VEASPEGPRVAARLEMSSIMVNKHTKIIYHHFGVQSRAELPSRLGSSFPLGGKRRHPEKMTSPVVNTFDPAMFEKPGQIGDVEMEFVYRTPETGPAGKGVGAVVAEDHPGRSFVCLGVQGDMDADKLRSGVDALRSWIGDHKADWTADGSPRRLGNHAPTVDQSKCMWEVQISIKAVVKPK